MALFYEQSFENFENLLDAMDRTTSRAQLFCFFVNKISVVSKAIGFEIDQARHAEVFRDNVKILVFPTDSEVSFHDLPSWMRDHWIAKAGYGPNDVARYITSLLLDMDGVGASRGLIGRGKALDNLDALVSDFIQRCGRTPNIFVMAGFSGIGRRSFAQYYSRNSLESLPELNFGPLLVVPDHAGIEDVYRAIRQEVRADKSDIIARDVEAFRGFDLKDQVSEIARLLNHFVDLNQSVRLITSSGFFEDSGAPKYWVEEVFLAIPENLFLFLVSNRQFDIRFIESTKNAVQMRIQELADRDIKTLMVRVAARFGVPNFSVPDKFVRAIGGHPDVAIAAVKIAAQRGIDALNRDPAYLYNVQQTIIGDLVAPENLSDEEKVVLDTLSWVPELGSDIIFEIFKTETRLDNEAFVSVCQGLVDGCIIVPRGYSYQISSAVRHLYRRWNITSAIIYLSEQLCGDFKFGAHYRKRSIRIVDRGHQDRAHGPLRSSFDRRVEHGRV